MLEETISAIILVSISEFLGVYLDGKPENTRVLHYAVKFVELAVAPFIPLMFNPEYDIITEVIEKADKNMYSKKQEKKEKN